MSFRRKAEANDTELAPTTWRREWDSNPRLLRVTGFQDQLLKPLGHLSELSVSNSACMILANIYRIVNSFFYFFTFFGNSSALRLAKERN